MMGEGYGALKHSLDFFHGKAAGTKEHGMQWLSQVDDGGLDSHFAGAAIQDVFNPVLQVIFDVLRGGGADVAEWIGAWSGESPLAQADDFLKQGVGRHSYGDTGKSCGYEVGNVRPLGEDQGEWTGPEGFGEEQGLGGGHGYFMQLAQTGDMDDERIMVGTSFGRKNRFAGGDIERICGESVNGFRGNRHKIAACERGGEAAQIGGRGTVYSRLHRELSRPKATLALGGGEGGGGGGCFCFFTRHWCEWKRRSNWRDGR